MRITPVKSWALVSLAWLTLAIPTTLWSIVTSWNVLYDDAYISFRYAQNLGTGQGLTWNPGEAPTEGFTNLLLVLVLSPSSALGLDPLLASRILGLSALISVCALLVGVTHRWLGLSIFSALVVGLTFAIVPTAQQLVLSGMETMVFTALLLAAVIVGAKVADQGGVLLVALFTTLAFCAYLTRPEAILLLPAFGVSLIIAWRKLDKSRWKVVWGLSGFAILIVLHLAWRLWYFNSLLPNPAYLKSTSVLITSAGAASVIAFISLFAVSVFAALAVVACRRSLVDDPRPSSRTRVNTLLVTSGSLVVLYLAFILRTDTLTDIAGRFTFPVLPFILLIGAPGIGWVIDRLIRPRGWRIPIAWVALVVGISLLAALPLGTLSTTLNPGFVLSARSLMADELANNQQLRLANTFSKISKIQEVKVAYGDAGLVPYESGLPWLDLVGLNDTVLSRTKSLAEAVDYVFNVAPDVMLLPVDHDGSLFTSGHGVLGDYSAWAKDSRWSAYEYVGTFERSDAPYDLLVIERTGAVTEEVRDLLRSELNLVQLSADAQLISVADTD